MSEKIKILKKITEQQRLHDFMIFYEK